MKERRKECEWLIVQIDQIQNFTSQYVIAAMAPNYLT